MFKTKENPKAVVRAKWSVPERVSVHTTKEYVVTEVYLHLFLTSTLGCEHNIEPYLKITGRHVADWINLLNPTGYVINQQFNIQQLYALPTLYLCVLYLSQNKQRLVPLTA